MSLGELTVSRQFFFASYCGSTPAFALGVTAPQGGTRVLDFLLDQRGEVGVAPCEARVLPIDQGAISSVFSTSGMFVLLGADKTLVRFDQSMFTNARVVGQRVLIAWESDLKQLTSAACANSSDPDVCTQQQIAKVLANARRRID